ncbi:twin-arginine translocation signal domain-containing protein [Natrinema sp. 74]|uniref:twin-arginine translocation signal domain-containing protein n=1 Tax=Natrinema sp. 74 TaxID=3384159 RepID=UPI0038D504B9
MTKSDKNLLHRITDAESRRSFLKKSAVTTVGASVAASGVANAQNDGGGSNQGPWKALMFQHSLYPEARFTIISDVLEWSPNYGGIDDSWFSGYNTRMIRWLNTGEHNQIFIANDAQLGQYDSNLGFVPDDQDQNQPQVYELSPEWSLFEDDPNLATINFSPTDEEAENQILESDNWWQE